MMRSRTNCHLWHFIKINTFHKPSRKHWKVKTRTENITKKGHKLCFPFLFFAFFLHTVNFLAVSLAGRSEPSRTRLFFAPHPAHCAPASTGALCNVIVPPEFPDSASSMAELLFNSIALSARGGTVCPSLHILTYYFTHLPNLIRFWSYCCPAILLSWNLMLLIRTSEFLIFFASLF